MQFAKILIVVTNHDQLGDRNLPTGFYLSEVTHPWQVFVRGGYQVDFVSPQGGVAPMVGVDLDDPINRAFMEDSASLAQVQATLHPSQVDPTQYQAIFYAGGHGTMWDFPDCPALEKIASAIYDNGGVVGAVCHGGAGLINIQLSDGAYLVAGKKVSCFTNEEEAAVGLTEVVPFLLESQLIEKGAQIVKASNFQKQVAVSDRLVTGQNPASATGVGEAMVELLQKVLPPPLITTN